MNKLILFIAWLAITGAGFCCLVDYDLKPGQFASSARALHMVPAKEQTFELITFIHPGCPCSRNTLRQIESLSAQLAPHLHVTVNVIDAGRPEDHQTLVGQVAMIKNAEVKDDLGGNAAAEAKATTSGQCDLYDPSGKLVFSGGITTGRSHSGESQGSEFIKNAVLKGSNGSLATIVYGCSLKEAGARQ